MVSSHQQPLDAQLVACSGSPRYFLQEYGQIYDATRREWIPFGLWPEQEDTLEVIERQQLTVILKARQLGLTWLVLGYVLWLMIFRPAATVLLFSKREDESLYLLSDERLRGMYAGCPFGSVAVCAAEAGLSDAARQWGLANGSVARTFPATGGDSYTATLAVVDEADLVPDLDRLMRSVKPTIDGGGQLVLLAPPDKAGLPRSSRRSTERPRAARSPGPRSSCPGMSTRPAAQNGTRGSSATSCTERDPSTTCTSNTRRPTRRRWPRVPSTSGWRQRGSISATWNVSLWTRPSFRPATPALARLEVYALPQAGHHYVVGADPAEGNPTSDDSALTVLDRATGEEVAALAGKLQPSTLAAHADAVGRWYNNAELMVERNNHGHAVLLWLRDNSRLRRLSGPDGNEGWLASTKGNALLYDTLADAFRNEETVLHSFATFTQLASIEGSTLAAPEGEHDDRADSYGLACVAIALTPRRKVEIYV